MSIIRFDILTIFPDAFASPVSTSVLKRAIEGGKIEFILHDIRQYTDDPHHSVDDLPYGGGAGMVMKAEPVIKAVRDVDPVGEKRVRILMTPRGVPLTQKLARELASYDQIIMVCGHYEGIDERAREAVIDMEVSVGDYVLTGGELPAMVICDAVARLIPGVLGNENSSRDETFERRGLEYPQYTRPADYNGMKVPSVLTSGDHKKIDEWRREQAYLKTKKVRPDLL